MKIFEFTDHLGSEKVIQEFLQKKLHIVCPAVNSLTNFNVFGVMNGGLDNSLANIKLEEVNSKNQTETFYPALALTVLPLSMYYKRNNFGNEEEMKKNIENALEVNLRYKAPKILFDFEPVPNFDRGLGIKTLFKITDPLDDNDSLMIYYV